MTDSTTLARSAPTPRSGASSAAAPERARWRDPNPRHFPRARKGDTTILFGGLTNAHDRLIESALASLDYKAKRLPYPDASSLELGKEFCSPGLCNPVYFNGGSLLSFLRRLRDVEGVAAEEIVDKYLYVAPGSCGPCRMGTYVTEYRKAVRDAGFPGFRVLSLNLQDLSSDLEEDAALRIDRAFYLLALKCVVIGDILNMMTCRIRPYETENGATDAATARCLDILGDAMQRRTSMIWALRRCRREFAKVAVNRLVAKPRVYITGEIWARLADGAGNYDLKRFLESEGAEVEVPLVINYVFYHIWCYVDDTRRRMLTPLKPGMAPSSPWITFAAEKAARLMMHAVFGMYARSIGLGPYALADARGLARLSELYYPPELRGGEGHIEVAETIEVDQERSADLVVSVKPFGCMPSSSVSDGIQALVVARRPSLNFLAIETTGDGAANVYSRVQMALFKARARAERELSAALSRARMTLDEATEILRSNPRLSASTTYPRGESSVTAANLVSALGRLRGAA